MENEPFEDVFPIENGDFPLLCLITGVYHTFALFDSRKICKLMTPSKHDCASGGHLFSLLQTASLQILNDGGGKTCTIKRKGTLPEKWWLAD